MCHRRCTQKWILFVLIENGRKKIGIGFGTQTFLRLYYYILSVWLSRICSSRSITSRALSHVSCCDNLQRRVARHRRWSFSISVARQRQALTISVKMIENWNVFYFVKKFYESHFTFKKLFHQKLVNFSSVFKMRFI